MSEEKKNVGGRPRKDVTKTPEFQAAVQAAVASALPTIMAALVESRGVASAEGLPVGDANWAQKLAASIAQLTQQGNGPKLLEPAEVTRRAEGFRDLIAMVAAAHAGNMDVPSYRVIAKAYLTDFVVEPFITDPVSKMVEPVEVQWTGIPNESLLPLNDSAKKIFGAFMQSVGGPTVLTQNIDSRALAVTPGGLVVKGLNASAHRDVTTMPNGSTTDLMGVRGQNDPRAKQVNVLGTIASPAIANSVQQPTSKFAGELRV